MRRSATPTEPAMAFPVNQKFKLALKPATPSPFDIATLKTQLAHIGLSCAQLSDDNLRNYIADVQSRLPRGQIQSMAIKAPRSSPTVRFTLKLAPLPEAEDVTSLAAAVPTYADVATGNWTIDNAAQGYEPHLEVIQDQAHFDWLYANKGSTAFTGIKDEPPAYTGNYDNADAIKKLFVYVCLTASATLLKGLDQSTMTAVLSNVISPLDSSQFSNYDVTDSRAIFVVDNYNPSTGYADAVGVVYVRWRLQISDWHRKSKHGGDTHPTRLQIWAGSVLYSDVNSLCRDYNAVLKQFGILRAPACPLPS
jgi:hypothetical protein